MPNAGVSDAVPGEPAVDLALDHHHVLAVVVTADVVDVEPRPDADLHSGQLDRIRQSDFSAVAAGRKELQRLIQAIDRGTWVRNAAAELLREESDPQLLQEFDRAGRVRADAAQAADELAYALAEAKSGLNDSDLRPGLEAVRKAQASEDRLTREPLRAGLKLAPAPLGSARPFADAQAKLASPEQPAPASTAASAAASPSDMTKAHAEHRYSCEKSLDHQDGVLKTSRIARPVR